MGSSAKENGRSMIGRAEVASRFLIAEHPKHGTLWAAIDPEAHHVGAAVAERRFSAYCSPFRDEDSARTALVDAGCDCATVQLEGRRKRGSR